MLKNFIALSRPFTLVSPFIGFLASSAASAHAVTGALSLSAKPFAGAFSCVLMNAASNIFNQITDVDVDRVNKPERPLPSGKCTKTQAWVLWFILTSISFFLGSFINTSFFVILFSAFVLTTLYSAPPLRLHGRGFFGNLTIGIVRGLLLFVAGWVSVSPSFNPEPWAAGAIIALFLCGASTTKDFSDIKGDRMYGVSTLPVKYGIQSAAWMMSPFLVLPYLLIPVFVFLGWLPPASLMVSSLAFYGAYILYLVLRKTEALALERNHVSWVHMYFMLMLTQAGFAFSFII